ncbi:restriction endonuclease subunit S [Streptomyces sp. NPDC001292]|uniref:restriction endonuclease subunit S n=1 Tax=Streptomyces sp. NPDC001292 TaxID=3364558 RepID=UPI00368C45D3
MSHPHSALPYGPTPPESWKVMPFKYLASLTNGYVFNSDKHADSGTPIIRIENLNGSENFNHSTLVLDDKFRVMPGDLLFSWSGNPGTSFGPFRWRRPGVHYLNQHIFNVSVRGCDRHWLYWSLKAATHWIERELTSGMIGMVHVTKDELGNVPIPIPPVEVQHRVARYLDAETKRIDTLICLREQQKRLWGDRARAYLYERLASSSPRPGRSTYIDWLGYTDDDWKSATIGHMARFFMGTTFPHAYQGLRNGDYPFIKVSDFQYADEIGRMETAENWISKSTERELRAQIVPAGAVLYARVGAALLLNRRRITTRTSVIDDNVRAISFTHGDPRFWASVLSLLDMGQLVNPGPVPSLSEGQVASVRVPVPPAHEQTAIADRMEHDSRHWKRSQEVLDQQLALLAERRQSLITAAVTGQFDVSTASGRNVTEGVAV